MRDTADSAAAPAARCRKFRRGSFNVANPFSAVSLDHLVGYCEQAGRNGEVERPRRLQVDNELEFGRLLDRQALLALENATDIDADSAPYVRDVFAVGHEDTNFCVLPYRKNCRNGKSSR